MEWGIVEHHIYWYITINWGSCHSSYRGLLRWFGHSYGGSKQRHVLQWIACRHNMGHSKPQRPVRSVLARQHNRHVGLARLQSNRIQEYFSMVRGKQPDANLNFASRLKGK